MLSQRMAKAYFQIGQGCRCRAQQEDTDTSVATFDRQLVELKNYAPTPDIKNTYLSLENLAVPQGCADRQGAIAG